MCFLCVASAEIRHAYEQFLIAISELIDGEVLSDELQQSSSLIYDIVHDLSRVGLLALLNLSQQFRI